MFDVDSIQNFERQFNSESDLGCGLNFRREILTVRDVKDCFSLIFEFKGCEVQFVTVCTQRLSPWTAKSPDFARKSGDFRLRFRHGLRAHL